MPQHNATDRALVDALSSLENREKLKLLLRNQGLSIQAFARKHGFWPEQVTMCISGERPYDEVRAAIADELRPLGLDRAAVDRLIDGESDAVDPAA